MEKVSLVFGGAMIIGGTIAEDFFGGGLSISDDFVTISAGIGMIIKAF